MQQKSRTFALAMLFESGLGFVGIGVAWLAGISLTEKLQWNFAGVERGLLATLPMLLMLGVLTLSTWHPVVEIRTCVEQLVREMFSGSHWLEIALSSALISLAAGVGEEVLFRGALQPWIASWTTPWIALAVVSLLFGLAHALTTSYFVLATLIGAYFGWLAMEYDDLVAPIVAHSAYDFVALIYFRWRIKRT
ncbi:MAG: CPBP family intramembrane metalloprotease [Planctomycetes bacterium]|nr:CPBP family intramembrane metalloprotease [Planctomycetota bacterium]